VIGTREGAEGNGQVDREIDRQTAGQMNGHGQNGWEIEDDYEAFI